LAATLIEALREAKKPKHGRPVPAEPKVPAQPAVAPTKTGPKILIIDDTEMLLIFVEDSLALADPTLQMTTALTGLHGVKEAARIIPDLVLVDYVLPDIKGDEVCRRIGRNDSTALVPIIMMSGHVHEMTAVAGKLPNVVATIPKPFISDALVELVQQTLKKGPLREKPTSPAKKRSRAPKARTSPYRRHRSRLSRRKNRRRLNPGATRSRFRQGRTEIGAPLRRLPLTRVRRRSPLRVPSRDHLFRFQEQRRRKSFSQSRPVLRRTKCCWICHSMSWPCKLTPPFRSVRFARGLPR
jgi:DNA-binding response OmpR family regulator